MINFISRQELWHPLSVHLPIAFLLLASILFALLSVFGKRKWYVFMVYWAAGLLCLGTLFLWITFYTGNLAYGPVVRTICYPSLLKNHLFWAYITCYSFSIISLFIVILAWFRLLGNRKWLLVLALMSCMASASLCYTGHLGANVVYKQGGGVRKDFDKCQ